MILKTFKNYVFKKYFKNYDWNQQPYEQKPFTETLRTKRCCKPAGGIYFPELLEMGWLG